MTLKISIRSLVKVAAIAATGAALASCSGHGSSQMMVMTTPTPSDPIAAFGTNFATDFHASATSTPVVPAPGDIIPLSFTNTPAALPITN